MAYRGQGQKVQKVMVQPINLIFRYLQNRSRIQVWLYEQVNMRIEGCIIGFDEYMNLVLDDAEEIHSKTKSRKQLATATSPGWRLEGMETREPRDPPGIPPELSEFQGALPWGGTCVPVGPREWGGDTAMILWDP
ncbi:Small nuclear ribonucleoprotein E [Turdus rufiventris]|nr:Small nuclear ribonucleoprotein E [Turdus rufiventris]